MSTVQIKRIYDHAAPEDGFRVLIDRLWPRGVTSERAALDAWLKEVAPTPELRRWWGHRPEDFDEFARRCVDELAQNAALIELEKLRDDHPRITLLYAARDPRINHAVILLDYLDWRLIHGA